MTQCRHFVVAGRVQGVFYRASTQTAARERGLTGWVRNCADGCVELVACGEAAALDALREWLWQGPPAAVVSRVSEQAVAVERFDSFEVRP